MEPPIFGVTILSSVQRRMLQKKWSFLRLNCGLLEPARRLYFFSRNNCPASGNRIGDDETTPRTMDHTHLGKLHGSNACHRTGATWLFEIVEEDSHGPCACPAAAI